MMSDEMKLLLCPFCGKQPVRVSIGTASCDGMVDGKEVHNTIGMRPECWNARATIEATTVKGDGLVERLAAISDRDDTTGLAADGLREAADTITTLKGEIERRDAAAEKLQALRRLCEASEQPFYVEIIDEVLQALGSTDNVG